VTTANCSRTAAVLRCVKRLVLAAATAALAASALVTTPASAARSPWWHLTTSTRPSVVAPGGEATITVEASNVGDAPTTGPVTLSDVLPPGVSVVEDEEGKPKVGFFDFFLSRGLIDVGASFCEVVGARVICTLPEEPPNFPSTKPFENIEMRIQVKVGAATESQTAEVSGGGAASTSLERPIAVGEAPPAFGSEGYEMLPEEEGGAIDTRAGSHPFQLTTTFALNQTSDPLQPPALPKDLEFKLPPGLLGDATVMPKCSDLDFKKITNFQDFCAPDTAVGVATVTFDEPKTRLRSWPFPIFNLEPEEGEPARFGFTILKSPVILDTAVRVGSDYGVTVKANDLTQTVSLLSSSVTFWGAPDDSSHDESRGWQCLANAIYEARHEPCPISGPTSPPPFLTLPTSCTSPFSTTAQGDSWPRRSEPSAEPATVELPLIEYSLQDQFGRALAMNGCNQLAFAPEIETAPDSSEASKPAGMKVDVKVPQEASHNTEGLSSSAIKDITVTFPQGVTVNPASAGGLEACSEAEVGFTGVEAGTGTDLFTPGLPSPFCPDASKVGTVELKVPILPNPLKGWLYLAAQNANPFGSLLAAYLVAEDPVSGVRVKLAGEVTLNEQTGQITSTFRNSPQAPLEDAEIHLFGGPRAPFSTPTHCGPYPTNATFVPWSGGEAAHSTSTFDITAGPNGAPCTNQLPFAPTLASGSTNTSAGAFTPLTTTLSREDGNQEIQTVQLHYPPGVSGILTGIPLCPEAEANAGTCSGASLIGHSTASVGLGSEPYTVPTGEVFLTEGYKDAPFGLSIVTPAVAGPFNLGKVIVRAKLEVDPHTAALTVTTDAIPHILKGIPLQIKDVNVTVDRSKFTFNPTNCNPMTITGVVGSVEGASAPVSQRFQAGDCAALTFAPKFQVSTSGKTSKRNGASLRVKLSYPDGSLGKQANIAMVKVQLPRQLPSRLATLNEACLAKVFEEDPTRCPAASVVGHAKVTTPVLPVPLTGSAYFVSHGGVEFPNLTIVLHGYGVTVDLVGSTKIKHGITTSTFKTAPDVPFSNFELTLPEGKFSALGATANLCKVKRLTMPTELVAQNGRQKLQATKIAVTGCPKKRAKKAQHHAERK
jgi:uncharacterized repeat protein (TIGR01451 family)